MLKGLGTHVQHVEDERGRHPRDRLRERALAYLRQDADQKQLLHHDHELPRVESWLILAIEELQSV